MHIVVICLLLTCSIKTIAQSQKSIQFDQSLSWTELKQKAKTSGKLIFIDCYASWCGPCKAMDKNVFTSSEVSDFMNNNYISFRVQFDTTQEDNEQTKSWYSESKKLAQQFNISAFPTFLFFTSEGEILHKEIGFKGISAFIQLAQDAKNPDKQFYTLLSTYQRGIKEYKTMPYLANFARKIRESEVANKIAVDYINNYILSLPDDEIFKIENINFMANFFNVITTKDKAFEIFYQNGKRVDSKTYNGFAENVIDKIITKEEIEPIIYNSRNNPNWTSLLKEITKKYNYKVADRNIINAKINWYKTKEDWKNFTKCIVYKVEKYGPGNQLKDAFLNDYAFYIFMYSKDEKELLKALAWSDRSLKYVSKPDANRMDTKANLLYKLGRTKEAIELQEKALDNDSKDKSIQENLKKMKLGQPTWLVY